MVNEPSVFELLRFNCIWPVLTGIIITSWGKREPVALLLLVCMPASVAQSDARLTGDQEVTGATPARSATFFRGD